MKFKLTESTDEMTQVFNTDLEDIASAFNNLVDKCTQMKTDLENVGAHDDAADVDSYILYALEDLDLGKHMRWLQDDIARFLNKDGGNDDEIDS